MGWLPVLMGAAAGVIFYGLGEMVWLAASAVATMGELWSFGVIHNYAMDAATKRPGFRGGFWDVTAPEAESAPNRITMINLAFAVACLGVLATALIFVF